MNFPSAVSHSASLRAGYVAGVTYFYIGALFAAPRLVPAST
jgi:hypothetical protein